MQYQNSIALKLRRLWQGLYASSSLGAFSPCLKGEILAAREFFRFGVYG